MSERDIFLALLDLPTAAERAAYLDGACGADAALRGRVESLQRAHEAAGSFLDVPKDSAQAGTNSYQENGATPDDETDEALGFLAPAGRTDSLGRIGHYEVLEVLGRGGFGIVFRAFDDVLQRVVAVKVLAPSLAVTSPARKRFLREAQSSARVRHENVVQVHAVGEQPLPYIAMEFIPGQTLQQRIDHTGPLEVAEVVRVGRQIAAGLAAAHEQGLIHRDIKPSNILIEGTAHGQAKITDFGLARAADDASLTRSGVVAGTPMFMAPEQAAGKTLDHRADLFSLGSVLYVMASGRPPFRAENTLAVLKRVAEDTPRPIREVIPEVPDWLCRVIEKLHAKDPADRFQSAREVAELLADCDKQLQVHKELKDFRRIPAEPARPRPAPRRKSRPWVWPVAAAFAILAVVAVGLFWLVQENRMRAAEAAMLAQELEMRERNKRWMPHAADEEVPGWGRVTDPDGDCKVESNGERVRITVPGSATLRKGHDLSDWYKVYNAARVVREVRGDFRARVRVLPFPDVTAYPDGEGRTYLVGSLLLWSDEQHFVRVDRAALTDDLGERKLRNEVVVFHTSDERAAPIPADLRRLSPGAPSYLELERRGDVVSARTSADGKTWSAPYRLPALTLPPTVRVGVAAVCYTPEPFAVEFEGFELSELPAVPGQAADVLPFLAGNWKQERANSEVQVPADNADSVSYVSFDYVAGGKVLRTRGSRNQQQDQVVYLHAYDAAKDVLQVWQAHSNGFTAGPTVETFNPSGPSLTRTYQESTGRRCRQQFIFVDGNTFTSHLYLLDEKNNVVRHFDQKFTRVSGPVPLPAVPADPKRPNEMKVLDRLVGAWRNEITVTNSTTPDKPLRQAQRTTAEAILGGRFVEVSDTDEATGGGDYSLLWYDQVGGQYRTWVFNGAGYAGTLSGTWDEAANTMKWLSSERPLEGQDHFKSGVLREFRRLVKDADGKVVGEANGVCRRAPDQGLPFGLVAGGAALRVYVTVPGVAP